MAGTVELQPPAWVPALPRLAPVTPAAAVSAGAAGGDGRASRAGASGRVARGRHAGRAGRLASSVLLLALAIACVGLAVEERLAVERLLGVATSVQPTAGRATGERLVSPPPMPPPRIVPVSHDTEGSSIDAGNFPSSALHRDGSFLLYLPPGFARGGGRYPVLYLLHGTDENDASFLRIGLQGTLDRLIAEHAVPPLIAVMIQGGSGTNNWLNHGNDGYESYVLETQRLIDATLPTIAARDGRAIAGYSMGGYGAMHLALAHPQSFVAVESWLGFFDGLASLARADRATFSRIGLRAFVYGGESDAIANPAENGPFAATLRADGAEVHSAVYPGEHDLATLEEHLEKMLVFAGRALTAEAG